MASSKANIRCGLCRRGEEVEAICGSLHFSDDCIAHQKCMEFSSNLVQYKFPSFGGFNIKEVQQEITRGKRLKCSVCKTGANGKQFKKLGGATSGCAIEKCRRSYHFYCAETADTVITKRIEVTKKKRDKLKKVVKYRVFCSEKHLQEYEEDVKNESHLNDSTQDSSSSFESPASHEDLESQQLFHDGSSSVGSLAASSVNLQTKEKKVISSGFKKSEGTGLTYPESVEKQRRRGTATHSPKPKKDEEMYSPLLFEDSSAEYSVRRQRRLKKHIREQDDSDIEDIPTTKEVATGIKLHGKKKAVPAPGTVTTREGNESEPSDSSAAEGSDWGEMAFIVPDTPLPHETKEVNSTVLKLGRRCNMRKAPREDCVLCFRERDDGEAVPCNQYIRPVTSQLFGVRDDSVYLWKFKTDDALITSDHMVLFMHELSDVVRKKDFDRLSCILCDREGEIVRKYDMPIKYNEVYDPELRAEIYYKHKESIRENLAHACYELGKNIGGIYYFKSLKSQMVFLYLSDILDEKRAIRNLLGHKNMPFVWSPDDKDIEFTSTKLTSKMKDTIHSKECEVLLPWIKSHIERPKLLVRPNTKEPYLQVESQSSITCRIRTVLEEISSDAHEGVVMTTIGPVNKDIINVWPYLQHCIPAVIKEHLTVLKDIFFVYDVDSRAVRSMQSLVPKLPSQVDFQVFCGQDPSTTPISCVLLQVSLNPDHVSSTDSSSSSASSPEN